MPTPRRMGLCGGAAQGIPRLRLLLFLQAEAELRGGMSSVVAGEGVAAVSGCVAAVGSTSRAIPGGVGPGWINSFQRLSKTKTEDAAQEYILLPYRMIASEGSVADVADPPAGLESRMAPRLLAKLLPLSVQ